MNIEDVPFNIEILSSGGSINRLRETKDLDIFKPNSREFTDDGLFSSVTFGIPGDPNRDKVFSYIDLKTEIFHPYAIYLLNKLKRMYVDVLHGRAYASWNAKDKVFEPSDSINGQTGFHFFEEHWKDLSFNRTESKKRDLYIDLFNDVKKKGKWMTRYVLVIPAGLRDIDKSTSGRITKDPINDLYSKLISASRSVKEGYASNEAHMYNAVRSSMQQTFADIYEYINTMLRGKTGLLERKWASRNIYYGTRNVITAMSPSNRNLFSPNAITPNHSIVGIFQHTKAIQPITIHLIKSKISSMLFDARARKAKLIDRNTLESVSVDVNDQTIDRWLSYEGIGKIINLLGDVDMRHKEIIVEDHYLALLYLSDKHFKIFYDIRDLPEGFDKSHVRPISYIELIYLIGYDIWDDYYAFITRYPAIDIGSIYPSIPYVKTTINGLIRRELDDSWESKEEKYTAYEIPDRNISSFFETLSPNITRLPRLGADHDGDTCSYNAVFTDEAIKEIKEKLSSVESYISPGGEFRSSASTDMGEMALKYLTYNED